MRDYSKSWRQLQEEYRRIERVKFVFFLAVGFAGFLAAYFYFAEKVFGQMQLY